jgi:hypothetical protein
MSEVGDDPDEVTSAAINAAAAGAFLVVPDEWRHAMIMRTNALLAGQIPDMPTPSTPPPP